MLDSFHIIAFTHRNIEVSEIGKLHIEPDNQQNRLSLLKEKANISELMFLSTCNRVEFLFCTNEIVDKKFLNHFFYVLYPDLDENSLNNIIQSVQLFSSIGAVEHIFQVASSIDSMIVGEREIITQVRNAFELSKKNNLTGDFIRLVMRMTIETAKRVYTETNIAKRPVSVVALAYHTLRDMNIPLDAKVLIIGAGTTNTNMSKFLKKHGYKNFVIFNRTFSKAQKLAEDLKGEAYPLEELATYKNGFDIIITCTGSEAPILTPKIYETILNGDTKKKVIIDIAIPHDLDPNVVVNYNVVHVSVDLLQKISDQNLKERSKEIAQVEEILREAMYEFQHVNRLRKVELAMREVPIMVKEIKATAVNHVFKNEMKQLDQNSKEVLDKIIDYMEKKYMSVPMKMAKDILLNQEINS